MVITGVKLGKTDIYSVLHFNVRNIDNRAIYEFYFKKMLWGGGESLNVLIYNLHII